MLTSASLLRLVKGFALACAAFVALPALAQLPPAQTTSATSQVTIASGLGNASGLAVDPLGNVYSSDSVNNTLSQIVGANGAANVVLTGLSSPGQVAVDSARNVYVAAGNQNVVLKFVYTAGALNLNTPVSVGQNLGNVVGVAVDLGQNVYIVDATNKQVVKVTSAGVQSVVTTGLKAPQQIAVDRLGNIFVADAGANAIVFIAAGTTTASTIGTGFNAPAGVAVDQVNNLYIADTGNSAVKEIPNVAGVPTPANQSTLAVNLTAPTSIAADTRSTIYVGGSGQIVHFSAGAVYFGLIQTKQPTVVTPVTITFLSAQTPATIKVVATGTVGLDFADAGGGTCSPGVTYNAGQTCKVNVTFTPLYAGPRYGAIVMYDASNKVVSRTFIGGAGLGPVITFDPGHIASFIPLSFNAPSNIALAAPHGIKFDSAGNTFFADTNSNRVIELPANNSAPVAVSLSYTLNDMTINGAGDLVVPDLSTGRMTVVPNENGTWNFADVIIAGTGYGKPRVVNVDVAGTMFFCDVTNNRILSLTIFGVQTQLNPGLTKGCLGTAVDIYGNVAVTDTANAQYIPISGQPPYSIANGIGAPWGIAIDASGSVYVGSNNSGTFYRIPNENGTLSNSDQQLLTVNKSYGITLDPTGNLFAVPLVGTSAPASGYNFNAYIRGAPISYNQAFTPVSTVACETPASTTTVVYPYGLLTSSCVTPTPLGALSNTTLFDITNSGNQAPVYTSPTGYALLGDIDDFGFGTPPAKNLAAQPYTPCNFTVALQPGAGCYVAIGVNPQSPGSLRQAIFSLPSQSTTPGVLQLLGFSAGTLPGGSTTLTFAQTSPMGTPGPFQEIMFTFATADAAATGSITVLVDGAPLGSVEIASGLAAFDLPNGLAAGTHQISATYSGDGTHAPLTTPVVAPIIVANATATFKIATSAVSANPGQTVTISANLGGATGEPVPSGTVTFLEGTATLGTGTLSNGNASFSTATLAAGTHTINYRYGGDTVYAMGNSATVTVTVGAFAPTTTTVAINPAQPAAGYVYGTSLTVVATVNPATGTVAPTGSVLFNLDGVVTTVALAGNTATFTVSPNAGTYTLSASYVGSPAFATSTGTASFTVVKINTVTTLKTSSANFPAGSNVTLSASVLSTFGIPASGTITFRNKATVLGVVAIVKGSASLLTDALPGGVNNLTATYSGDANDNTSTSAVLPVTCTFNSTSLTNTAATVIVYFPTVGVPNTLNAVLGTTAPATVLVPPTGTVLFTINGQPAVTNFIPGVPATSTTPAIPPIPSVPVGPVPVSSGGVASLNEPSALVDPVTNLTTLPTGYKYGVNTVTATYSGDNDYSPSSTTTTFNYYIVPLTGYDGDYTITATPSTLPITIGTTGSATVTITPVAKYFGYVQVTCAGLPLYATCILQPDQVLLDGTGTSRTMALTVLTQAPILVGSVTPHQVEERLAVILGAPVLLALALGSFRRGRKVLRSAGIRGMLFLLLLSAGLGSTTACGGHPTIATPAGTYNVLVTGSGSGPLNTTITDITDPRYGAPTPIVHTFAVSMTFK